MLHFLCKKMLVESHIVAAVATARGHRGVSVLGSTCGIPIGTQGSCKETSPCCCQGHDCHISVRGTVTCIGHYRQSCLKQDRYWNAHWKMGMRRQCSRQQHSELIQLTFQGPWFAAIWNFGNLELCCNLARDLTNKLIIFSFRPS